MVLKTKKGVFIESMPPPVVAPSPNPSSQASLMRNGDTGKQIQRFPLPHNSMFVMGLETNRLCRHMIPHDNRPFKLKSPEEQSENGERISLTFRHIGTFLTPDEKKIFGQGAKKKTREEAGDVINYDDAESLKLINAFSKENHDAHDFLWEEWYGEGSDVLHFKLDVEA
jgi:hypothetical protein